MSAQVAGKAAAQVSKVASKAAGRQFLNQGARRDPELYVLGAIMCGAFGLAGFYFGRNPTSASAESHVHVASGGMPWQTENDSGGDFKYKYHPGANEKNAPKDAPSALHSVIIPNVNLPKELHERYNKWGKDGY